MLRGIPFNPFIFQKDTMTTSIKTFEVRSKELHALALLSEAKGLNTHYQGVWLDPQTMPGKVVIFATNGFQIGLLNTAMKSADCPDAPLFIPVSIIKKLAKNANVSLWSDGDTSFAKAFVSGAETTFSWSNPGIAISNWRRVVPSRVSDVPGAFDVNQLHDFAKVNALLSGIKTTSGRLSVRWNSGSDGGDVFVIRFPGVPDFLGLNSRFTNAAAAATQMPSLLPTWMKELELATS